MAAVNHVTTMGKLLLHLLGRPAPKPFERDPELDQRILDLLSAH